MLWGAQGPNQHGNSEMEEIEPIVAHMYDYSHYRLKLRPVSPRSKPFLKKYRDAAKQILDHSFALNTQELKIKLAALNKVLHSASFLMKESSILESESFKAIKELQR